MLKGDNLTVSLGKENKELSEVNHSWRVCVLPLCSGEGVSRGSSDRKMPTSSRALVTTGSLALKSLLKPCDDTNTDTDTKTLILRICICFSYI